MDQKRNWVYRRSTNANRLQKEEIGTRLKFYKNLEEILVTGDSEENVFNQQSNKKTHHALSALAEDSGISMSPGIKIENEAATDPASSQLNELPTPLSTEPPTLDSGVERSESITPDNITRSSDWELADNFHAALGPELDVVLEQIRSVLEEGLILFPLELISRLYLRFGRRLPQLYEGYSSAKLLAWLKLNSRLDLSNLIFMP